MGSKRTRDRQLAKLAARRQQERAAAKRRRDIALGVVGTAVALVLVVGGFRMLTGDDRAVDPSATPTPTVAPTGAPEATGEVARQIDPPGTVACGAEVPPEAGSPKPQFDRPPGTDLLDPDVAYRAVIETSCGTIVIDLDAERAPQAVANFIFLAREGFYDGLTFGRIAPDYVIQAGDPTGTGGGGPGYTFPDELAGRMRYPEGTLAMANAGPNSNGSQWFIVSGPDGENLEQIPNYTIFGAVADGMEVVESIDAVPQTGESPEEAVYIDSIRIRERPTPDGDGASPAG